jgi:hypothetical protein
MDGVVTGHGDPDDRQVCPTNSAMFGEYVFEPLADWIATSLVPARAIGFGAAPERQHVGWFAPGRPI